MNYAIYGITAIWVTIVVTSIAKLLLWDIGKIFHWTGPGRWKIVFLVLMLCLTASVNYYTSSITPSDEDFQYLSDLRKSMTDYGTTDYDTEDSELGNIDLITSYIRLLTSSVIVARTQQVNVMPSEWEAYTGDNPLLKQFSETWDYCYVVCEAAVAGEDIDESDIYATYQESYSVLFTDTLNFLRLLVVIQLLRYVSFFIFIYVVAIITIHGFLDSYIKRTGNKQTTIPGMIRRKYNRHKHKASSTCDRCGRLIDEEGLCTKCSLLTELQKVRSDKHEKRNKK